MNPYVKKVDKKKNVIIGVLSVLALGLAGGAVYGAVKLGKAWNPVKDLTTVVKGDAIDWGKVEYDRNFTILNQDDTAKTVNLGYYDDSSEYVKVPQNVGISGTAYTVSGIRFTDPSGHYEGGIHWVGKYNLYAKALMIPNTVKEVIKESFLGITSLALVYIPDSVTSIGASAFSGCTALPKVDIPDSVTSIGVGAFSGCNALAQADIPDSLTSILTNVFCGCAGLAKVDIPDSVTSIGVGAFSGCTALAKVDIPDSVTSIGASAFSGCNALANGKIPNLVKEIASYSFFGLKKDSPILVENMAPTVDANAFYSEQPVFFDAYKANVTWATFATERTKTDKKVYYKGQWDLKDGLPTPNGKEAEAVPASAAASSAAASSSEAA